MEPFVFVVGAERSGTTMLRGMLDGHSELAVVYEPHVITELDSTSVRHDDGALDVDRFAKAFLEHRWFRRWELSPGEVLEALTAERPLFYPDAVRCLYGLYARRRGKCRYGDKSPSYIFRMIRICELFPEARFVHLLRDGRDTARSLQEVPFGPSSFPAAVRQWRSWVEAGIRAGDKLGPSRYLEIHYEDLTRDPQPTLGRVCEFIGLRYEPGMLRFHERADEVLRHERANYHNHLNEPLRADLRDWRRDLSDEETACFDQLGGALNSRLGYQPATHGAGRTGA